MSRTDLVADTFTMIRNAAMARKETLDVPASKMNAAIMAILKQEQYIEDFKAIDDKKQGALRVYLKYKGKKCALTHIGKVSRPGLRIHMTAKQIPDVLRGRGISIVTTSSGIMTGKQAKEKGIGGEVLAYIW